MTLRLKLIGGLLLCFFVALVTIFYGGLSGQSISDNSEVLREQTFPALEEARALQQIVASTKLIFQDALETSDPELLDSANLEKEKFRRITQEIFAKTGDSDIIQLGKLFENYVQRATRQLSLLIRNQPIDELFDMGTRELDQKIQEYRADKLEAFTNSLHSMQTKATSFKQTFVVLGSFAIVVIGMILIVVVNIQKRLASVVSHASRLGRGDFESSIETQYEDELGSLESTFEGMRKTLRTHIIAQDELVAERTQELEISKNQIQQILDNINQGIVVMDFEGRLGEEHSRRAEEIFPTPELEGALLTEILHANAEDTRVFNLWLTTILKPQFQQNWKERGLDRLNPFNLVKLGEGDSLRYLQLDFELVFKPSGDLAFIMVLASDVTRVKQIEAAHQEQEEQVARLLAFIDNDIDAISFFLTNSLEAALDLNSLSVSEAQASQENLMREFHTIRGNSGTFGFSALAQRASEVEDYLMDIGEDNIEGLHQSIQVFLSEIKKINLIKEQIMRKDESRIEVDAVLYHQVNTQVNQAGFDLKLLQEKVRMLPYKRWGSYYKKYYRILEEASDKVSKGQINLKMIPESFLLSEKLYELIDGSLVHMLRNSVDHGIELPEERQALSKGTGEIILHLTEDEQHYFLEVSDNGAGLDPENLGELAVTKGLYLPSEIQEMSEEDKLKLIFHHGFSSRSSVGYFSGRGVGMDVVKTAIDSYGGQIQISNKPGRGVSFILSIPKGFLQNNP